jgi:hypothetical protein
MSNALAIATVTATLRRTLQITVDREVGGATVTTVRPDASGNGTPTTGVNIYLYQVTPNAAWRNADLPTRRPDGQGGATQHPRVALDLHYVLTFYGDESRLQTQHLLGIVARTLHGSPILTRQMIQATLGDSTFSFLTGSDLANEVESVKFTPLPLSLEELSRLWSVLFQVPYALSMAYHGAVVFIDSQESVQSTLPVRERKIYVTPFRHPVIERIASADGPGQAIVTTSILVITGPATAERQHPSALGSQCPGFAAERAGHRDSPASFRASRWFAASRSARRANPSSIAHRRATHTTSWRRGGIKPCGLRAASDNHCFSFRDSNKPHRHNCERHHAEPVYRQCYG